MGFADEVLQNAAKDLERHRAFVLDRIRTTEAELEDQRKKEALLRSQLVELQVEIDARKPSQEASS